MRILEDNETWDWCRERGFALANDDAVPAAPIKLASDPTLVCTDVIEFPRAHGTGREAGIAAELAAGFSEWDDCVVWITDWGVWPSSEDWPRYYAWRGAHGNRRSLENAPGHLFAATEMSELIAFLAVVIEFGWDATVLLGRQEKAVAGRLCISHDEFAERWERPAAASKAGAS